MTLLNKIIARIGAVASALTLAVLLALPAPSSAADCTAIAPSAACELDTDIQISTANIGAGAIEKADIAGDAIDGSKVADDAIANEHIANNAVQTAQINNGAVTEAKLANNAVSTRTIANNAVTGAKILDGTVGSADLANSAVTVGKIANGAVTGAKIAAGTITADKLAAGAIGAASLGNGAVTEAKLANNAVSTRTIATGAVNSDKIADGSVALVDLAGNSVDSSKIVDGSVALVDLAGNSVDSSKIVDGSIATVDLANNAVTTAKIADAAVTTAKIADAAVTTAKIADNNVTYGKLSHAAQRQIGTVNDLVRTLRDDGKYLTTAGVLKQADSDSDLDLTDPSNAALNTHLTAVEQAFASGTPLGEIQINGQSWTAGVSDQQIQDQVRSQLNLTLWSRQEIGLRTDTPLNAYVTQNLPVNTYRNSSLRAQTNYLAQRIGLNPNETPNVNGSIQAQLNYLKVRVNTGVALAAALQDPYIPAGKTGSFSIASSSFGSKSALSFGLASIMGTRSRLAISAALTEDGTENLVRLGYSIAW